MSKGHQPGNLKTRQGKQYSTPRKGEPSCLTQDAIFQTQRGTVISNSPGLPHFDSLAENKFAKVAASFYVAPWHPPQLSILHSHLNEDVNC